MEKVPVGAKNRPTHEIKLKKVSPPLLYFLKWLMTTQVIVHANPLAEQQS